MGPGGKGDVAFLISFHGLHDLHGADFLRSYVMRGVIEDKSSRVIEVLLSSAKPREIMTGKIVGIGAAGLVQMGIWSLCLLFASTFGLMMAKQLAPGVQGVPIPSISPVDALRFRRLLLIGYFMYSSVYAAMEAWAMRNRRCRTCSGGRWRRS